MYVTIVDENDNAPVFQQPHYEVVLDEGPDTVNASLITVQALDLDEGPNGTVTYAIVAGNIINTFRIGRRTVSSLEAERGQPLFRA